MTKHVLPTRAICRRQVLALAPLGVAVSGCFGSFSMTRAMHGWIGSWRSKWLSWLGFLGFLIIGAYGVTTLVDALVLNAIEFFRGKAVFDNKHTRGKINTLSVRSPDGRARMVLRRGAENDSLEVDVELDGKTVRTASLRRRRSGGLDLHDANGTLVASAVANADGVGLEDAAGRRLAWLTPRQADAVEKQVRAGASVEAVIRHYVDEPGPGGTMLASRGILPPARRGTG